MGLAIRITSYNVCYTKLLRAPSPRRLSVGLEQNRLAMLLAVAHRHAGIQCADQDVFVNSYNFV